MLATKRAQAGMVMIVALIVLVLMTLGGLALMRSMDTSNMIAGNMAFQQSATHSADTGIEAATAWLEFQNTGATLDYDQPVIGYSASTGNNAAYRSGEKLWADISGNGVCLLPVLGGVQCTASPGTLDASGNTVAFVVQRLCNGTGPRNGAFCAVAPGSNTSTGNNEGAGEDTVQFSSAVYYRISVRVVGPRNTIIYVQSIVSM